MKLFKFNHSHIAVAKSIAVTTLLLGMLALSGGHWSSAWALPASLPGLPGITATNQATTLPTLGATVNSAHVLHPCARPTAGSPIPQPAQVSSTSNTLDVKLDYYPDDLVDSNGNHQTTFCFLYTDPMGNTSAAPTLHAKAGDTFNVAVTNHVAPLYPLPITDSFGNLIDRLLPLTAFTSSTGQCGAPQQFAEDPSSVNVHFHGFLVTPQCQGDNVARTIINAGQTFQYSFKIPMNEPPGLYWFHPHVHGSGEQAVQGGASGTLIIDGLEQFQPSVAHLPSRVLVLRDQPVATDLAASSGGSVPSWDVSVNYVPVTYRPTVKVPNPPQIYDNPGIITMQAGGTELWRVANASADSILDFEVHYVTGTGAAAVDQIQTLSVVGLDGVPIGSQDGTRLGHPRNMTVISMAPGQRAEFVINAPGAQVTNAFVRTRNVDAGLIGDTNPVRVIAKIQTSRPDPGLPKMPAYAGKAWPQRFEGAETTAATEKNAGKLVKRKLYFYEELLDPAAPQTSPTNFYIAVQKDLAAPYKAWGGVSNSGVNYPYPTELKLYEVGAAPVITAKLGTVESWTVENRALEAHVFHIHQIHFKLTAVSWDHAATLDYRDDYTIPAWNPPAKVINGALVPWDDPSKNNGTGTLFSDMTDTEVATFLTKYPYPSIAAIFDFRDPTIVGTFVFHCHILAHEDQGMMAAMVVQ